MRAILAAKLAHDRLQAEEGLCSRLPEFAHAWFARQPVVELTKKERTRLLVLAQQGAAAGMKKLQAYLGGRLAVWLSCLRLLHPGLR